MSMTISLQRFNAILIVFGTFAAVVATGAAGSCTGNCATDASDGDVASMLQTGRQVVEVKSDLDLHGHRHSVHQNKKHRGEVHSERAEKHLGRKGNSSLHGLQAKTRQTPPLVNITSATAAGVEVHQSLSSEALVVTGAYAALYLVILLVAVLHETVALLSDGLSFAGRGFRMLECCGISTQNMLVMMCAFGFFEVNVECTALIPTSYDLTLNLGYGAAISGWLCSMSFFGLIPGALWTKRILKEEGGYDQYRARLTLTISGAFAVPLTMLYALSFSFLEGKTLFWTLMFLRLCIGAAMPPIAIVCGLMAFKVLSPSGKTMYSMGNNVTKNLGLAAGPFISAVAIQTAVHIVSAQTGETATLDSLTPVERSQCAAFASAFACLFFFTLMLLAAPLSLDDIDSPEPAPRQDDASSSSRSPNQSPRTSPSSQFRDTGACCSLAEIAAKVQPPSPGQTPRSHNFSSGQAQIINLQPDNLTEDKRQSLFWYTLMYCTERAFTVAAVEVSTLMLLETTYEKDVVEGSYLFSTISILSAGISVLAMLALRWNYISEINMGRASIYVALFGSLFFFDWGGIKTLLFADLVVYCFSGVAMGIAEAWGAKSAIEGSRYSEAAFRQFMVGLVMIARISCPPLARAVVDAGGRPAYAIAQFLVAASGCYTLMKCVWLLTPRADPRDIKSSDSLEEPTASTASSK
jgi:hypothetical protein